MDSNPHQVSEPTNLLKPVFIEYIKAKTRLIHEFSGSIAESYRDLENTLVGELNQLLRVHGYTDIITRDDWVEDYELWYFENEE